MHGNKPASDIDLNERLSRHLDWNLLRTFIAIVQYRGISRAAENIHLTQPAVSQALKRLETHLGQKLIERNARKFEVTKAGQLIYAKAQEIHNQISRLGYVAASEKETMVGHLRLLFASRLKSRILDDILRTFHQAHPGVTLRVDVLPSVEIQALVQQGSASAGFCLLRGKPKRLKSELVLRQAYGLFCGRSHALYGRSDLTVDAMRNQDLITYPSDQIGGVLSPLAIYREQHAYEGRLVATSPNLDEIMRLTELGIGVGLMPIHIAEELEAAGDLWRLPPHSGIAPIDIHLLWNPASNMTEAERAFLDCARAQIRRHEAPEQPGVLEI